MRLDSVHAENFLSHRDSSLAFPFERMQVDGLNGAGKTSLAVDAPLWALFGQARGATTDSLKGPWGDKMSVEVVFEVGKKTYRVKRMRGGASALLLKNETDSLDLTEKHITLTQGKIHELLGSYNAFVNTAIVRQGDALRFANATAAERNALFDELVGVEAMSEIEKKARQRGRTAEMEAVRLEQDRQRLLNAKQQIEQYKHEHQTLRPKLAALEQQEREHERLIQDADDVMSQVEGNYRQRQVLANEVSQAEISVVRKQTERNSVMGQMSRLEQQLKDLESPNASLCPTCGAELEDDKLAEIQEKIRMLRHQRDQVKTQLQEINDELPKIEAEVDTGRKQLAKADSLIGTRFEQAKKDKLVSSSALSGIRNELRQVRSRLDTLKGAWESAEADLGKLPAVELDLEQYRKRAHGFGIISEAFSKRGIPRELKRGFAAELEKAANGLLAGLAPFSVRISLEKDGVQRGGVTEGTVDIWIKDTAGERRVEMLSGGEKMRVMLSIRLATAQVMAKRSERGIRTLILDESLDGLDQSGRDTALTMITALTSSFDRMLFITHDPSIAGLFPDRVQLGKLPDGSSVVL